MNIYKVVLRLRVSEGKRIENYVYFTPASRLRTIAYKAAIEDTTTELDMSVKLFARNVKSWEAWQEENAHLFNSKGGV